MFSPQTWRRIKNILSQTFDEIMQEEKVDNTEFQLRSFFKVNLVLNKLISDHI